MYVKAVLNDVNMKKRKISSPSDEQCITFNTPVKIATECSTVQINHNTCNTTIFNNLLH